MPELRSPDATMRTLKRAVVAYNASVLADEIVGPGGAAYSKLATPWDSSTTYEQAATRASRAEAYLRYYGDYSSGDATGTYSVLTHEYFTGDMPLEEGMARIEAHGVHEVHDSRERQRQAVLKIYSYLLLYLSHAGEIGGEDVYEVYDDADVADAAASQWGLDWAYDGVAATIGGTRTSQGYVDSLDIIWSWRSIENVDDLIDDDAGEMTIFRTAHRHEETSILGYIYVPVYEFAEPQFDAHIDATAFEDYVASMFGLGAAGESFRSAEAGATGEVTVSSIAASIGVSGVMFAEESISGRVIVGSMDTRETVGLQSRFGFSTTGIDADSPADSINAAIVSLVEDLSSERFRLINPFDNIRSQKYKKENKKAIPDIPDSQADTITATDVVTATTPFAVELLWAGGASRADVVQATAQLYSVFYGDVATAMDADAAGTSFGGAWTGFDSTMGY